MIRLIATDLDGTLLNQHSELSPRTCRAVQRVMETGARFVISSGRMYLTTRPFAGQLDVNAPVIVFNGAMACDWQTGTPLFKTDIPVDTARAVCAMAEKRGVFAQYFPERGLFYQKRVAAVCDEYENRVRFRGEETVRPLSEWISQNAVKLMCLGEHEVLLKLRAEMAEAFPQLRLMLSQPTYLEIVSASVDKGDALRMLAERLGVTREEIAAFGDADNDVGMLEYAGSGYVMQNGNEQLLARVPLHAPANTDDGVARVLEDLLARGEIGG